ncbi:MAG TPA: LpqB family beta-propeller domain-containing protein, partial [Chloroflexia bacterium]|nr:LpqB family beta-propeller domain-containing protein [Chloroflexia bacterium]
TPRTSTREPNQESPGGTRLVQYFDKSRMEINDPSADPNGAFYVTNGLLTVELISGNMQIGAAAFSQRYTACINIAGDSDDATAPTYASFRNVSSVGGGIEHPDTDKHGTAVTATIDRNGVVGTDPSKGTMAGGVNAYFEPATRHNIPQAFWTFLNQQGPVTENGQTVTRQLIVPWFYASGYPISDAYWANVKVAGQTQAVLIQAFQRRVLTYNPSNTPAFQVEMGNIGLHYYDWRYNNAGHCAPSPGTTPVATSVATAPAGSPTAGSTTVPSATATPAATSTPMPLTGKVTWVTNRSGKKHIWRMNADGTTPVDLTAGSLADNYDPALSANGSKVAFVSNRDGNAEIYVMNADGTGVTRVTNNAAADTHPTWSPDATRLAFVSDRSGNPDVWTTNVDGTGLDNITQTPGNDHDPAWANTRILFASNRSGRDQLYVMNTDGTAVSQITNSAGDNTLPAWSVARNRVLFVSTRDGNPEIYTMQVDGTGVSRVTNLLSNEYDPTWSPDGLLISYASNRDGNNEIYVSALDGSNLHRLTNDPGDDTHPAWH